MNISAFERQKRTISSALWAAYGDAIGFTTELADESLLKRRTGSGGPIATTVAWHRLVGGKFGALVELPAGTYSDDTQLRLATSRCIRHDGHFDVELLAKIELPVWLSYSLGSGLGSKAAATSLCSSSATWYSNFFKTEKSVYINGGGNGAAMRIQPHVWCAHDLANPRSYLPDVVRNAISTHGHVRGIAGAMLHAAALAFVLRENRIPAPEEWQNFSSVVTQLPSIVDADSDLKTFWLPTWESESKTTIHHAAQAVASEWRQACGDALRHSLSGQQDYKNVVTNLGGLEPDQRGSGLKSALFSLCAAWAMRLNKPDEMLEVVANFLSSDTDTIGTMSGALVGALANQPAPPGDLQDRDFIIADANRLYGISARSVSDDFNHPDLLYWQPPKSALDTLGVADGDFTLYGLGLVEPVSKVFPTKQGETCYQWFRMKSGQTLLCKRRSQPRPVAARSLPQPSESLNQRASLKPAQQTIDQDLFGHRPAPPRTTAAARERENLTLDVATNEVIHSNFNATIIGKHLLRFTEEEDGLELAVAYAAIVAKARRARIKKGTGMR